MSSYRALIGQAIADELNADPATNFNTFLTADFNWGDWEDKLANSDTSLKVDVVPGPFDWEPVTRSQKKWEIATDIAIRKRLPKDQATQRVYTSDVNELDKLVQDIADFFFLKELTNYTTAKQVTKVQDLGRREAKSGVEILTSADRDHLQKYTQFTGVIRLTYEVIA